MEYIKIKGAREHNLKNISLDIPKNKFVVITGVSGSGKSSLAFDTIYSEGQRRYVESLSAYARQFIGQMKKPELDSIEGLSPAISIEQKSVSKNPRSTVGTMTEIYDYMRLLWAHIGIAHCPICKKEVSKQSVEEIVNDIYSKAEQASKLIILAPIIKEKKGTFKNLFINFQKQGYQRIVVDDTLYDLDDEIDIDKNKRHSISLVIDRIKMRFENEETRTRISEAIENSSKISNGFCNVEIDNKIYKYSENFTCSDHENIEFPDIVPRLFSFNAPFGACEKCNGLGSALVIDENKLILNENLPINDGGVYICGGNSKKSWTYKLYIDFLKANNIDENSTYSNLTTEQKNLVLYGSEKEFIFNINTKEYNFDGTKTFEGIVGLAKKRYKDSFSEAIKDELENKYMIEKTCSICSGDRLKEVVLNITINGKSIIDITKVNILEAKKFFENLILTEKEEKIAKEILKEIKQRLNFMLSVGLEYLSLARNTKSLSGGESQRIRLATQIGSKLTGVIYVLDEPSIGLHQRDNERLLNTLKELRDLGNTVIVVEHDEDTMKECDYLIDIGPGAGIYGGNLVACGTPLEVSKNSKSITGKYLSKELEISLPKKRRKANKYIEITHCKGNNLKDISVKFPKGVLTVVTGVSGSGKSTLINQTLFPAISNELHQSKEYPLEYKAIKGLEDVKKVINIDQSPIGRTPRSNTATYTKIFDDIREIFSQTNSAKIRGFDKGRFSFNVKGGRCEACSGAGIVKIEMNFLPDVYIDCELCKGKRYNHETLEVVYKDKNIADVLEMTVDEAFVFFEKIPSLKRKLQTLIDVGMGYISLGQSATTLSGGEAQRIKLSSELSKISKGDTIYILDEPTTGLHFEDIKKLLSVLNKLVDKGNTIIVIEHNLDVIKSADYIIDIGPQGGINGGCIIAKGTPEQVSKVKKSYTGYFLKKCLGENK
ncbi:excinuclease ABC subunit UvrA [Sneathia sanguinegens]|uniref:excinuclease ABC subunit UvrA n=1 Tax=Sneathia sanguinegens TaxID=40543 RepID=UPI002907FD73|nr:excinuclease ABC subunit UvrA [Sneathia sanguinegens]MDU7496630.1 excinuclease ABC subunit UvrA [Sneathia sanguinegens]